MSQEEARRRVEAIEDKHATELARLEERNRELRSRLLEGTYENTKLLRDVSDLSSKQFTLEKVIYLLIITLVAQWEGGDRVHVTADTDDVLTRGLVRRRDCRSQSH